MTIVDLLLHSMLRAINFTARVRRKIRRRLLIDRLAACGRKFVFGADDVIGYPANIFVGDDVFIGAGAIISANGEAKIRFGNEFMAGPRLVIMAGDHDFHKIGRRTRGATEGINSGQVLLEEDVWCGACVTILKQVTIGEGAVVGAGSVVSKSLPPYTICAGNPCRAVRLRFSDEDLRRHLAILGRGEEQIEQTLARRRKAVDALGIDIKPCKAY